MATGLLERPVEALVDDEEIVHAYCCHPNVALCGADIADLEDLGPNALATCKGCADLIGQYPTSCPHGEPW